MSARLKDSIFNEETSRQIIEIQTRYETEQKEKEIQLLTKENKIQDLELNKNKIIIYAAIALAVLLFVLVGAIYARFQTKKKANTVITRQKLILEEKQKEILDSINYAQRIQKALITSEKYIERNIDRLKETNHRSGS
jgi:hypothetical protein